MTVYSKTMAGRMVAVDQQSGLTPALKDFLKGIDGKTSPEQLVERWRDGPNAIHLLRELERRGLVEVRSTRWSNSSANSAFSDSHSDSHSHPNSGNNNRAPAVPQIDALERKPSAAEFAPKAAHKISTAVQLNRIKDHMATFILTYLPHHAIPVLKEIENLESHQQLQCMLAAYANLAHEAGRAGLAHIKSLRSMLED